MCWAHELDAFIFAFLIFFFLGDARKLLRFVFFFFCAKASGEVGSVKNPLVARLRFEGITLLL